MAKDLSQSAGESGWFIVLGSVKYKREIEIRNWDKLVVV